MFAKSLKTLFLITLSCTALAQVQNPFSVAFQAMNNGQKFLPTEATKILKNKEKEFKANNLEGYYNQAISTYFSLEGQYDSAIYYFDKSYQVKDTALYYDKSIEDFKIYDAKSEILKLSKAHQVLMFNESHHNPLSRAFINSLLPDLKRNGYTFLCAEDLQNDNFNKPDQYLSIKNGFYSNEPFYAELLRSAKEIGFNLYAFDDTTECENVTENIYFCNNQREFNMATKLQKIFLKDPNSKIVVLTGYDHISKKSLVKGESEWIHMAEFFFGLTGIEPLCMDLTSFYPRSGSTPFTSNLAYVSNQLDSSNVIVLKNGEEFWVPQTKQDHFDISIFFPLKNKDTIKSFAYYLIKNYQLQTVTHKKLKENYLCKVFIEEEFNVLKEEAVPIAQQIASKAKSVDLYLPLNKNLKLIIYNTDFKILAETTIQPTNK